jgi:hypothetical protein
MIELFINDIRIELYENAGVGVTYQSANLANLNSRGGFYTNKFKIPLTAINKAALENGQIVNSDTNIPYEYNKASLISDGIDLLTDGVAIIESTGDQYAQVNILSGNSDFFNLISNVNLNDLDFSEYSHTWNAAGVEPLASSQTTGLVYPFAGYSDIEGGINTAFDSGAGIQVTNRQLFLGEVVPSIFCNDIFDKIEAYTGWTLDGDLRTNAEFLKRTFSANKFLKSFDDKDNTANRIGANNLFYNAGLKAMGGIFGNFARIVFNMPYDSYSSTMTQAADLILCDADGNYEFDLNLNLTIVAPEGRRTAYAIRYCEVDSGGNYVDEVPFRSQDLIYIYDTGYDVNKVATGTSTIEINETFKCTYYMENGNYYKPFLYYYEDTTGSAGNYTSTVTMNTGCNISFKETSTIYPLDDVDCEQLYDWKITDFIKDIILMFGVNLQPNNITKTLSFNLLKDVPNNTVEDWSDKVNLDKGISLAYKYGSYNQINNLEYGTSDDLIDGSFSISDLTLNKEGTIIKTKANGLPLNYDYTSLLLSTYTNCIAPVFDPTSRLNNTSTTNLIYSVDRYEKVENKEPYFMRVGEVTPTANTHGVEFIGVNSTGTLGLTLAFNNFLSGALPFARFRIGSSAGMGFDQISLEYYQTIIDMFNKTKVVTLYLNLSPVDILNLDFSKPKRISNNKMNDDFYLMKVENYKTNQSTKCTFIRL